MGSSRTLKPSLLLAPLVFRGSLVLKFMSMGKPRRTCQIVQGYPGLQSVICNSDLLLIGGDGVWGAKQLVVEAAVLPVDEAACEPASHA